MQTVDETIKFDKICVKGPLGIAVALRFGSEPLRSLAIARLKSGGALGNSSASFSLIPRLGRACFRRDADVEVNQFQKIRPFIWAANIFAVAMKFAFFVCAYVFLCSPAFSVSDAEGIAGNYGLRKGMPANGLQIILECTKEVVCRYTTISQWKGDSSRLVQVLDKIEPLREMDAVRNALAYAVEQRNRTITHEDFAESMCQLRPTLALLLPSTEG